MRRILHILILLFSYGCCFSQKYDAKAAFAVETYAYIRAQSAALEKISRQFPHLRPKIAAIENVFERTEKNLKQFFKEKLSVQQFDSLQTQIDALLRDKLSDTIQKVEHAQDFILKVKDRSHISAHSTLPKGILCFKYDDAPHQEIADGHFVVFSSKNHPKAQNISIKIPVPESWLAQEADVPQTIQQFTSCQGNGTEKLLIVVYELPQELHRIRLSEKSVLSLLPPHASLIRTESATIDGIPGMMAEVEELINYQNQNMKIRMLQFMFLDQHKLYCLQGSIGPSDKNEDLGIRIKKYEPLFRLVASRAELGN